MRDYGTLEDLERWRKHFEGTPNEFSVVQFDHDREGKMVRLVWADGRENYPITIEHVILLFVNYLIPLRCGIGWEKQLRYWSMHDLLRETFCDVPLIVKTVGDRRRLMMSEPSKLSELDRELCSIMTSLIMMMSGVLNPNDEDEVSRMRFKTVLMDDLSLYLPLREDLDEALPVIRRYFNDVTIQTT